MLAGKAVRLDPMKRGLRNFEFRALNYKTLKYEHSEIQFETASVKGFCISYIHIFI